MCTLLERERTVKQVIGSAYWFTLKVCGIQEPHQDLANRQGTDPNTLITISVPLEHALAGGWAGSRARTQPTDSGVGSSDQASAPT